MVVTSVSVPGRAGASAGPASATGAPAAAASSRTGAGGASQADRSAYTQRPSGDGHSCSYAASSVVSRVTTPLARSTRNTGRRPWSSAVKKTEPESADQAASSGLRSRPSSTSRASAVPPSAPSSSGITTSVTSPGLS